MEQKNLFKLNSTNAGFNERQKSIFDQLKIVESNRKTKNSEKMEVDEDTKQNRRQQRAVTKHLRGKESIFKKPQHPVPRNYINRTPDFKKNPHKWTKYSLEDIEDMTEESNKKSALSFLKELADRKKLESGFIEDQKLEELPTKIIFKKKLNIHTNLNHIVISDEDKVSEDTDKPVLRNFKVVMPEYVVGQKVKKDKKKVAKTEKGKELKLDHLYEDE